MTVAIVLAGVVLVIAALYFLRLRKGIRTQEARIGAKLAPIAAALQAGKEPDAKAIANAAADPESRNSLWVGLAKEGRDDLFPDQYKTQESFAESDLAYWLGHPNELTTPPDIMELINTVPVDSGTGLGEVNYFVFRFRVKPPHWASDRGWMAGVSGPYLRDPDAPPAKPPGTWSELEGLGDRSPEELVAFFHRRAADSTNYAQWVQMMTGYLEGSKSPQNNKKDNKNV